MSEIDAYMKLYGWLVLTVPHYRNKVNLFMPVVPNYPCPSLLETYNENDS